MKNKPCKYFIVQEFVSEDMLTIYGEDLCWGFMDWRILRMADRLRKDFGPMICNDWFFGGTRSQCGLRQAGMPHYKPGSQHTFGRALDLFSMDYAADEIRDAIKKDRKRYKDVTGLEEGVTWLHIDCRYPTKRLQVFEP